MTKTSLGGGYGLNRNLKAASHLGVAIPPHNSVTVKPGVGKKHHKNVKFTRKADPDNDND